MATRARCIRFVIFDQWLSGLGYQGVDIFSSRSSINDGVAVLSTLATRGKLSADKCPYLLSSRSKVVKVKWPTMSATRGTLRSRPSRVSCRHIGKIAMLQIDRNQHLRHLFETFVPSTWNASRTRRGLIDGCRGCDQIFIRYMYNTYVCNKHQLIEKDIFI
ncbi:uncharacterized protein LOC143153346 [Ptiloglossa arizonensis]|uniref:uncharacterized protein LOC143153346 n=1 Tax=Ptiloglossa arizonensis TaxID=3350558 RepID=UPI003FA09631